jgi:hypothetical protein
MFRLLANLSPDRAFDQVLHFARPLVDLREHEALKERIHIFNLDSTCHTRRQLITVAKELFPRSISAPISKCQLFDNLQLGLVFGNL